MDWVVQGGEGIQKLEILADFICTRPRCNRSVWQGLGMGGTTLTDSSLPPCEPLLHLLLLPLLRPNSKYTLVRDRRGGHPQVGGVRTLRTLALNPDGHDHRFWVRSLAFCLEMFNYSLLCSLLCFMLLVWLGTL